MLFNSPVFVVFFVVVFSLYWGVRKRVAQNVLLIAASYVFYGAWSWFFLGLLVASTVTDFACGLMIGAATRTRTRRLALFASIVINLTFLGAFKYAGFFVSQFADLLNWLGFQANIRTLEIVLPVGISFYTFQSIGYVIDVYRGKHPPTRNLLDYALYVAFFPQLVAGPIERASHMLPQFRRERSWHGAAFESGLQLMVWGLFKKIVIADTLAPYVNAVYAEPAAFSGAAAFTATVFFAFQIYCDFSGYSDTARGAARTLGFDLMKNFDYPYFSKTPVEFWRRWHISLSQWFQDYLYFPLAMRYMRKGGWASRYKAHIIAMTLIGFWHGANWTFVVFGVYWGGVIAFYLYGAERFARRQPAALPSRWRDAWNSTLTMMSVPFMFVVACVGWILFRAESLTDAVVALTGFFRPTGSAVLPRPELALTALPVLWALVGGLWLAESAARRWPTLEAAIDAAALPRMAARYVMLVAILFVYIVMQGAVGEPFIYFQF
jgi:D-alanyl-lipoteichoic acid acyltransferase DltB (MBOAT superfamily)